ncbi:hypothetical protein EJ419_07310 [Alloscardovia theropitheci]|uniref:Phage protein Gp19/Gp15/Gp42 n=1 Tax=Alloscardovia theropitheci TaxID=2496842 RepID=A0A4R0QYZ2_9BIFI|nr:Gp19/Gp15/Gp42 family protein [Alloscardovia theropitheci]TCD53766.1 hypothetical protein EJ419_07310 [Alloscardovia theropitheci]
MEEVFATVEQLKKRYNVSSSDEKRATQLLSDASDVIRSEIPPHRLTDDKRILEVMACAMVQRALAASTTLGDGLSGVSQATQATGPFSQSWTFTNPTGDLYLSRAEKRRLSKSSGQTGFHIDLAGE